MSKFADIFRKALLMEAYASRTRAEDPLMGFMFHVSIEGIEGEVGFQSVNGISREVEVVEYFESGYQYAHKLPGRETYGEVTFARGMYPKDDTLRDAYEKCFAAGSADNFRCLVTVSIHDRADVKKKVFNFYEAWFSSYTPGDLDSTSSDVLIETLVMQYEYMKNGEV